MEIKHGVETEEGSYVFQGKLEGPELKFVVEFGLNQLMANGAFPFVTEETMEKSLSPIPDKFTEQ